MWPAEKRKEIIHPLANMLEVPADLVEYGLLFF